MTAKWPEQRSIRARVLTRLGWMVCTFHVGVEESFADFLTQPATFFRLTDVITTGGLQPSEFLALRTGEAWVIVPECDEAELKLADATGLREHVVVCWLGSGEILGKLALEPDLRVSDSLLERGGFVALRGCAGRGANEIVGTAPVVFVNASQLLGVSEREAL